MASLNKVQLIGNCGKDPEIRAFQGGGKVATITLATSERYKDRDGNPHEDTEWHSVQVFGKLTDIVEKYVRKGSMLYVEGRIRTRSYDSNGVTKYITEIVAQGMQMLNKVVDDRAPAPASAQVDEDLPEFLR
jgi:single-strand DNA-binding protein